MKKVAGTTVAETMNDFYTQEEIAELRSMLKTRHEELGVRITRHMREVRQGEYGQSHEGEWGKCHSETTEVRLLTKDTEERASIERALGRIDVGNFGICLDCDDPIGIRRLIAKPFTRLCIDCKTKEGG